MKIWEAVKLAAAHCPTTILIRNKIIHEFNNIKNNRFFGSHNNIGRKQLERCIKFRFRVGNMGEAYSAIKVHSLRILLPSAFSEGIG
jgi:hypothetical protein